VSFPELTVADWIEGVAGLDASEQAVVHETLGRSKALDSSILEALREADGAASGVDVIPWHAPSRLGDAGLYLEHFFSNSVRYLGPLRDEPKPLYPLAATGDPKDVGLRGETTAAVLDLHKNMKLRYVPSSAFAQTGVGRQTQVRSLEAAVVDWLQYLGVAEEARSIDRGKLGHEFKVRLAAGGPEHDLTHVGVGVSQVLPILVMCLLAEPDTTLIFEHCTYTPRCRRGWLIFSFPSC